jgi:hypothetical protein
MTAPMLLGVAGWWGKHLSSFARVTGLPGCADEVLRGLLHSDLRSRRPRDREGVFQHLESGDLALRDTKDKSKWQLEHLSSCVDL